MCFIYFGQINTSVCLSVCLSVCHARESTCNLFYEIWIENGLDTQMWTGLIPHL